MSDEPIMVNAERAAELLGISTREIYEAAAAGKLRKRYIGSGRRSFRFLYTDLRTYAEGLPEEPGPGLYPKQDQ